MLNDLVTRLDGGNDAVGVVLVFFDLKFFSFGVAPVKDLYRFIVVVEVGVESVFFIAEVKLLGNLAIHRGFRCCCYFIVVALIVSA